LGRGAGYYGPEEFRSGKAVSRPNSSGIAVTVDFSLFDLIPNVNDVERAGDKNRLSCGWEKKG